MTTALQRPASGPIRVRPAPRREPPFDDEVGETAAAGRYDRWLPLSTSPPTGPLTLEYDPALPDPGRWSRSLLIGVIETAGGRRPLQQLSTMFTLPVATGLGHDLERAGALGRRHWTHAARVRSVHAVRVSDCAAEISATLQVGSRIRAVAMRLEARDGRWRCSKLHLG